MNLAGTLTTLDFVIIALYFAFIVYAGLRYGKSKDSESYFLAGRSMTWPVIGFSMFAASISSSTLIGKAGDAFATGIAVFDYDLVSIIVMIVFAWFFLPFYIKSGIYTLPEFLERRFDSRSRYYFSGVTILINIFLDAAGALYAAALVMKLIFPEISVLTASIIFAVLVAVYTIPGGLSAAIRIDLIQGVILTLGAIVLTCILSAKGGGEYVASQMQTLTMSLVRPMNDSSVPWLGMIVGIPVLGFFFWGNNQQLVQRALTAKSIDEGRKGVLLVGFLTLLVLFFIIMPGVMANGFDEVPERGDMVYPYLVIRQMPVGLVGFLLAALLAALTSSLSGLLNSVAALSTMDFYSKLKKNATSQECVKVGKIVSLVVLVIAVAWAPQIEKFDSLVKYYNEILSMLAPPIVSVFFLGLFWKRTNSQGAFYGLVGGALLGVANLLSMIFTGGSIFGSMHFLLTVPIYLVWSILVAVVVSLLTKPDDYERIRPYIWTREEFDRETRELKKVPFYRNYRYQSYALVALCVAVLIFFW